MKFTRKERGTESNNKETDVDERLVGVRGVVDSLL
jgi:hypothetical protein